MEPDRMAAYTGIVGEFISRLTTVLQRMGGRPGALQRLLAAAEHDG